MAVETKFTLQVDWNNDGVFTGTGEDVSARTLSLQWSRGRDAGTQLVALSVAGQMDAVLNNNSGDYSSFNTASPLSGNLLPGRKVRLLAGNKEGFPYTFPIVFEDNVIWKGSIDSIEPSPSVGDINKAVFHCIGPLGVLNQKHASLAMSTSILTGTLIGDILNDAGWPAGDRDIEVGKTTVTRFWLDRMLALNALRVVEQTEGGFLAESRDGKVVFEDRHHRLLTAGTTSQATFTDAVGAARGYSRIRQIDPLPFIFNEFEAHIRLYTVGALATLWTLAESGADSPSLVPGESRTFWAQFPNPDSTTDAFGVDAWTTPVATTDYIANTKSDGTGTDRTSSIAVIVSKFGEAMKITLTNNHAVDIVFLTLLQARGTPITSKDPVRVSANDAISETRYGERTFTARTDFIPGTDEGQNWADYHLSIYKDPVILLEMTFAPNKDENHRAEALGRDLSDRITVVGTGKAGLGVSADFFIEAEHNVFTEEHESMTTWLLSQAEQFSDFWVLGVSKLGIDTRLAY